MGFVPYREEGGQVVFIERALYGALLEAGKLKPGASIS
jgi:hypothetical protein